MVKLCPHTTSQPKKLYHSLSVITNYLFTSFIILFQLFITLFYCLRGNTAESDSLISEKKKRIPRLSMCLPLIQKRKEMDARICRRLNKIILEKNLWFKGSTNAHVTDSSSYDHQIRNRPNLVPKSQTKLSGTYSLILSSKK